MPPKVKITKEDIIKTAGELVRKDGEGAINARNIASNLCCSTQPVFSNFSSMDELKDAVYLSAYDIYLDYLKREVEEGNYPMYKAFGMAYIRFAKEEKNLFKFIFMCDRKGNAIVPTVDFNTSIEIIMKSNGITKEKAELFHLEMWSCVHGIGTMIATSFLELDWELISKMISDIYQGLRVRYIEGDGN